MNSNTETHEWSHFRVFELRAAVEETIRSRQPVVLSISSEAGTESDEDPCRSLADWFGPSDDSGLYGDVLSLLPASTVNVQVWDFDYYVLLLAGLNGRGFLLWCPPQR